MGSDIYAKFVQPEEFIAKIVDFAAQLKLVGEAQQKTLHDAFIESELATPQDEAHMGSDSYPSLFMEVRDYLRLRLPDDVLETFDFYLSMLLPEELGFSRTQKHEAEMKEIRYWCWFLDRDEVRLVKNASTCIDYLRQHRYLVGDQFMWRNAAGYWHDKFDEMIGYLEMWLDDVVNPAIERNCGLVIYAI